MHSEIQNVTHHYQRWSSSQYLLQMQVQAQQRSSDALTTNIIPSSQKVHQEYIVPKSDAILTLTKMNTCMTSLISFPLF